MLAGKLKFIFFYKIYFIFSIYIFSYWKNKLPRRGWLYLSVEYLCFHSYFLGIEDKIIVRWTDVINLDKNTSMLSDTIKVTTRDKREVSSTI